MNRQVKNACNVRAAPSCIHELIFGCQVCGSNDNNHHISANKRTFNQCRFASPTGVDAEVLKAVDQFYKAFLAGNIETVKRMTADDYLQTDVNGQVHDALLNDFCFDDALAHGIST